MYEALIALLLAVVVMQALLIRKQQKQVGFLIGLLRRAKAVVPQLYRDIAA